MVLSPIPAFVSTNQKFEGRQEKPDPVDLFHKRNKLYTLDARISQPCSNNAITVAQKTDLTVDPGIRGQFGK
jgi:hypothetical protein